MAKHYNKFMKHLVLKRLIGIAAALAAIAYTVLVHREALKTFLEDQKKTEENGSDGKSEDTED